MVPELEQRSAMVYLMPARSAGGEFWVIFLLYPSRRREAPEEKMSGVLMVSFLPARSAGAVFQPKVGFGGILDHLFLTF